MNDDLTKKLNDNIQYMKKNYCTNYAGCQNRGLNIFCLNKGIVTAIQCTMCDDDGKVKESEK